MYIPSNVMAAIGLMIGILAVLAIVLAGGWANLLEAIAVGLYSVAKRSRIRTSARRSKIEGEWYKVENETT